MNVPSRRAWRTAAHVAALLFCPWWLMATTMSGTPQNCFTGIGDPTKLRVVLGSPVSSGSAQSCVGVDGLVPGGSITLSVTQLARPQETSRTCNWYDTTGIDGATGVTLKTTPMPDGTNELAFAVGTFAPPDLTCIGTWRLVLRSQAEPFPDQPLSPLAAGPTMRWFVDRKITIPLTVACGGGRARPAASQCEDSFPVESITELTP